MLVLLFPGAAKLTQKEKYSFLDLCVVPVQISYPYMTRPRSGDGLLNPGGIVDK